MNLWQAKVDNDKRKYLDPYLYDLQPTKGEVLFEVAMFVLLLPACALAWFCEWVGRRR